MSNTTGYGPNFLENISRFLMNSNQSTTRFYGMNPATTAQAEVIQCVLDQRCPMASKNAYAKLSPEEKKIADEYLRTKDKPEGNIPYTKNPIAGDLRKGRG